MEKDIKEYIFSVQPFLVTVILLKLCIYTQVILCSHLKHNNSACEFYSFFFCFLPQLDVLIPAWEVFEESLETSDSIKVVLQRVTDEANIACEKTSKMKAR